MVVVVVHSKIQTLIPIAWLASLIIRPQCNVTTRCLQATQRKLVTTIALTTTPTGCRWLVSTTHLRFAPLPPGWLVVSAISGLAVPGWSCHSHSIFSFCRLAELGPFRHYATITLTWAAVSPGRISSPPPLPLIEGKLVPDW